MKPTIPSHVLSNIPTMKKIERKLVNSNFGHTTPKGFTMTELMVVIVIVAVLASISFIYVKRGITAAERISCLSSMRQFGAATGSYLSDNNGIMPGPFRSNGQNPEYSSGKGNLFSFLYPYLGLPKVRTTTALPESLCCPSFQKRNPDWNANGRGNNAGRAYVLNQDQRINGARVFGPQETDDPVKNTMRYVGVLKGTSSNPASRIPMLSDYEDVHGDVRNMLFFDLHVETRPMTYPVNGLK